MRFPTSSYFNTFAGVPKYMAAHNIGIAFGGWGADWPDGCRPPTLSNVYFNQVYQADYYAVMGLTG